MNNTFQQAYQPYTPPPPQQACQTQYVPQYTYQQAQGSPAQDDGSLAFLNIKQPKPQFSCRAISQKDLVNQTFWVIDFEKNVKTRYSKNSESDLKTVVKIRFDINNKDTEAKFFTGSKIILSILEQVEALNAFPRKVTLVDVGNQQYSLK